MADPIVITASAQVRELLTAARTERGLSQATVARHIYISRPTLTNWESGDTQPHLDGLIIWAATFGYRVQLVLDGGGQP